MLASGKSYVTEELFMLIAYIPVPNVMNMAFV